MRRKEGYSTEHPVVRMTEEAIIDMFVLTDRKGVRQSMSKRIDSKYEGYRIEQDHHEDNSELFNRADIQDKDRRKHVYRKKNHISFTTRMNSITGTL